MLSYYYEIIIALLFLLTADRIIWDQTFCWRHNSRRRKDVEGRRKRAAKRFQVSAGPSPWWWWPIGCWEMLLRRPWISMCLIRRGHKVRSEAVGWLVLNVQDWLTSLCNTRVSVLSLSCKLEADGEEHYYIYQLLLSDINYDYFYCIYTWIFTFEIKWKRNESQRCFSGNPLISIAPFVGSAPSSLLRDLHFTGFAAFQLKTSCGGLRQTDRQLDRQKTEVRRPWTENPPSSIRRFSSGRTKERGAEAQVHHQGLIRTGSRVFAVRDFVACLWQLNRGFTHSAAPRPGNGLFHFSGAHVECVHNRMHLFLGGSTSPEKEEAKNKSTG